MLLQQLIQEYNQDIFDELFQEHLFHQNTIYTATYAAMPFLAQIACSTSDAELRKELFINCGVIEASRDERDEDPFPESWAELAEDAGSSVCMELYREDVEASSSDRTVNLDRIINRRKLKKTGGVYINIDDVETLKLYLNKHNSIILPTNGGLYFEPAYDKVAHALRNFEGSYSVALQIQQMYEHAEKKITFEKCIQLANRLWSFAYPHYPNKVAWHEGCQGWFQIWKEVKTNRFFIECDECSLQFDHPADIGERKAAEMFAEISVYPTAKEIAEHGWDAYTIKE
ncbi:DUF1871 family protein [Brevibacillus parabrevis]|uniref:DUF1871 family protein n=1 Tax=Brevibacillus parabrevis TaxID=54914 RepID=UPI0028D1C144|nr:DUF1871 family protein [Brevibacillus parabrevis]MED1724346.1 DUF1871 family protein [Brevibacillus parabrevis]